MPVSTWWPDQRVRPLCGTVHPRPGPSAGHLLLILEVMKTENEVRSPRAGTITEVRVAPGDRVN